MGSDDGAGRECDRFLELASHPTRRSLLRTLQESKTTTVEAAADALVDDDEFRPEDGAGTVDANRLAISLYHVHLPKMADEGAIDFDPTAGTIRTNETTERVCDALDELPTDES